MVPRFAEHDGPHRLLILLGTRPEAIKLAPVASALRARQEELELRVVSTGQHDDLLNSALASLDLKVDQDLGIMRPDQDLYDIGIECLEKLRAALREWEPHVVVVEGDTGTVASLISKDEQEKGMSPVYEKILYERNRNMADKVGEFLKSGKTSFVGVGAGHLVGEKGIIHILRERGYQVQQL